MTILSPFPDSPPPSRLLRARLQPLLHLPYPGPETDKVPILQAWMEGAPCLYAIVLAPPLYA